MRINLAYGREGLEISLPEGPRVNVIEPIYVNGLKYPDQEVLRSIESPSGLPPLSKFVRSRDRVAIVVNDITRATPYSLILPVLLKSLDSAGVSKITFFVALGSHRINTEGELCSILGPQIVQRYRIVQNDAFNVRSQICIGKSSNGNEVYINREFYECDVKILTGFIEPHFFAGFSGGPKAVVPGMAGLETILKNHDVAMIDDPAATWATTGLLSILVDRK